MQQHLHSSAVWHRQVAPRLSLRKQDIDHITSLCWAKQGLENEAVLLSGLWLMKQHSPDWYNGLNGSVVASRILAQYSPPMLTHSQSSSACEDSSALAILDMWWFASVPGGFDVPGKEPGAAWLACLHRQLWSFAHQPVSALKKLRAVDVLLRYIQAVELQSLQQEVHDVQRLVRQLYKQTETYFLADRGKHCAANQQICGYYLTHLALSFSRLHTSNATGTASQRKRITDNIHEFIAPYFRGSTSVTSADMDLLNEVLFVYPDIVDDPRNDEVFSVLADLWAKHSAIPKNCHMAITNAFAAGTLQRLFMHSQ